MFGSSAQFDIVRESGQYCRWCPRPQKEFKLAMALHWVAL